MNIKEYHATDHLNSSSVKEALKSLKKYKFAIDGPPSKSTPAMDEGSAVHSKIGEPHLFARDFAVKPYGMSFVTKEGKAWKAENKGKTIISAEKMDFVYLNICTLERMVKSIYFYLLYKF